MSITLELEKQYLTQTEHKTCVPVIDMHLHFVDFLQQSEGIEVLLQSMKHGNLCKNVVFGLPVKKKWEYFEPQEPHYYLGDNSRCIYYNATDELLASAYGQLAESEATKPLQALLAPTLCGFDPTDLACIDYIEMMFEKYDFWRGIGEVLLRHDDLTNLTIGETARSNHPALEKVYRFCAKRKLPICLHQNSTCVASSLKPAPVTDYEYLHELIEVLEKHPETTFIWAHCGVSRRVQHPHYHQMVSGLLSMFHNLYVDLSWVVYDDTVCESRKDPQDPLLPKPVWVDLVEEFQDRVMLGSDLCGWFDSRPQAEDLSLKYKHGKTMARYNGLLERLSQQARQKVAAGNAERLYFS